MFLGRNMIVVCLGHDRAEADYRKPIFANFSERNEEQMTNIWKRSLSLFLALVMVFGMLPVNALAAEIVPETTEITSETETVMPVAETPVETTEAPPATTEAPTEGTTAPSEEAEETTAPSGETEGTTAPSEEPEETTAPAEETTASTEETTAPSEEPEETTAPAEETTEPVEETEEASEPSEETVPEETEAVATKVRYTSVPNMELPSDEDLFEGYAENVFYGNGPAVLGTAAGETLSGDVKLAYDALVPVIHAIASGERASAIITVGYDLGYVTFEDGTSGTYDAEVDVAFAGTTFDQEDLDALTAALLADLPYELYWFDKVTGLAEVAVVSNSRMNVTFAFTVAANYRGADTYTANTAKTGAAKSTVEAANAVVKQVAADENVKTDYDILAAYKDWICEATDYNDAAAKNNSFVTDDDPWQMIYVFDGNASTTVVCEGYSKAFQYLCDLTEFEDRDAECYSVTGNFKSGTVDGPHMWNIVKLDGAYYMVDVTNSDTNTVGDDGSLFMVGTAPNASGSYTFGISTYTYDETTEALWADTAVLTMATSSYKPANADTGTETTTGMTQAKLEEGLAAAKAAGTYYTLSESFTLEENMTIDQTTDDGYVYPVIIASGVTLTVPSGVKLTLRGGMQISGTLVIEDGATLAVGDSSMWGNISMDGGKLVIGSTAKLTFGQYGVIYADPTVQNGITGTVPAGYLYGQYIANTEEELLEALADTEYSGNTISGHDIYVHDDITLTKNLTIGVNDYIMAQNGCTLTVNSGVTVTNKGGISVYQATLNNNGTIANSGYIGGEGWYTGTGRITGTAHQIREIVRTSMTQAEFEAALESSGGWYTLNSDVVITEDYATPEDYGFWIDSLGSLTIAEGATFTANGQLSTGVAPITINGTLVSNVHMSVDGSGNKGGITVSETGTLVNNSQLLVASGSLTINGTYSADSTGWISWDCTNAVIVGEEKIGKENIEIQIIADTEEELIAGMVVQEGYRGNIVYTNANITLNSSLEIPEGIRFTVGYSWREDGTQYQYGLTLAEGVTLTNNGNLYVNDHMYLTVGEGAALVNNGFVWVEGKLESYGTIQGNDPEGDGTILIHAPAMSQADFAAAVAEAAAAGEVYSLTNSVTLTSDMTIDSEVHVEQGASLTVADGAKLMLGEHGHLIASGGTITVKSGAALDIEYLVQVWGGGTLTIESGADITGVQADEIWINLTEPGRNTVTGIADSMLGAIYNPQDAAGIEAAYANTDTYAHIGVYPVVDITLDRNITIPEGDDLNLSEDSGRTLTVPAGFTLTNNGWINISTYNRLEILKGATIVNNGSMYVDQYAQFVVRGTYSGDGFVDGEITYGGMSHADLIDVIQDCYDNNHGWVHESETILEPDVNDGFLEISMGEGPAFYLAEGGVIRVPAGCTLKVYNPLILIGGQVIVEAGGTLDAGDGHMEIREGTLYAEEGANVVDNGHIQGKITWEGETGTYLSGRWLENWGEGWFENTDSVPDENAGLGVSAMSNNWVIFYLKTWDSENLRWNTTPVVPTEASEYLTFTKLVNTDETIKSGEANAEYFLKIEARGVLNHTDLSIFVDGNPYPYSIWQRDLVFATASYASLDTVIVGNDVVLDTTADAENVYYLILNNDGRVVQDITFTINTWGEDYDALVSDGEFLTQEVVEEGKVWKFTVDPEYTDYIQYDWKNFEISYVAQIADPDGDNAYHTGDALWVHAPDLLEPEAVFYINGNDYLIYDTGAVFRNYPTEEVDEWGNQIWARERTELPAGVSYELSTNTMTLENAALELLSVGYDGSWTDDEGNLIEEYRMPSADFTLNLVGSNTITCDNDAALAIWGGANVTITGDGSLHMKAVNSPDNVNDQGNCYAYQTVHLRDGGSLTVTGNADVTAEIAGSGFHGDIPAQMTAICGDNKETLTVSGNAELTIVMPDMRTIDESQENYPGARGLTNVSIMVNDNATLNADSIYLWDGVDFTQNGGTVNLNPLGEVFWNEYLNGYMLSHLGVYMEEADSVFTMNGGTMNINVDDVEEGYVLNIFQAINVSHGEVVINGGELNINGAQNGTAIALQCAMDENGPIAGLPTGNMTMTGGTINIEGTEGWMYEGIYASPLSKVSLTGGTINADYSDNSLEGNVTWDGTEFNGTVAAIRTHGPGEFTMNSGEINLTGAEYEFDGETIQGNAAFEANGSGKILGGKINITNGVFRNNMSMGIEGGEITINNDWADLPGIENNLYLPIMGGTVDVTANGLAIQNNGTFHQMGGYVKVTNTDSDNDNSDVPSIHSTGSLLINDGTMDVTGGYYGIIQNYNFDLAADEEAGNESVLFVGAMEDGQVPTLNIRNTKMGVYASAPVDFQWNANVNIEAEGTPTNNGRDWPTAIFVDAVTDEGSTVNVASLNIDGGANVNLTSRDTAGVDAMSKGIVAWYSPVTIQGFTDDSGEYWAPNVTIDAEMAVYSASDSAENDNFSDNVMFKSVNSGLYVPMTAQAFGDGYIHSLLENGEYVGSVEIGEKAYTDLDAFIAGMQAAKDAGVTYELKQSLIVDRDVEIIGIVNIGNGVELTVKDGAVLTIPEATQLTVCQGAVLTVEAGGQVIHQGAFLSEDGIVRINDDSDHAGYVRDSQLYFGQFGHVNNVDSVIGIPKEDISLEVHCETEDQIHYLLGICEDYFEVRIFLTEDVTLHTMTIPEKVSLFIKDGITVTVEEFLTVNGYVGVHSAKLVVNGTLINNNSVNPGYGSIIVNGKFVNRQPLFLNRGAEMIINGTMDNYAPVHVGFEHNEDGVTVGTLTIAGSGVMNNHDYLNICADEYVAEENRYSGGVVNVEGTLNNLNEEGFGFIEHHGELIIDGSLYNKNVMVLYGSTTVNGTLTNYYDCSIDVYGDVTINGTLDNSGSFWMYDSANVTATSGSVFGNYASVRNGGTGALSILGEIWGSGEVLQDYFENGTVATVNGLDHSRITLCYEGADEGTVLNATDYAANNGYMNYVIRVTGDLTISEGTLLRVEENGYLVVMNNGDAFQGSLTVYGDIVNLGYMNIFAADVTIQRGGSIYNKNHLIVRDTNYGVQRTPTVTVNGVLENESTGIMDLSVAKVVMGETGKIQNNWVDGQLGELYGVEIADQTLWTNIHDTTSVSGQIQLMTAIKKVESDGYRHGIVFVVTDTNIYSDMVVPEFVTVQVANGATLTVDEGVVLQTDSYLTIGVREQEGHLVVNGTLGAMAGMVNVNNGTMVVNGEFHEGETTVVNIAEGATLTINGNFGVDAGTLNVYGDCYNNGTMSVTWTEEKVGTVNGYYNYQLFMPINDYFPGHDENDMLDMIVYAEELGIEKTQVHFFRDYKFSSNFVVPENMTFTIGAYPAMAATVTVPAGKTLMVNGDLEVAKDSKLVIEEGAELIFNGEYMNVYGTLENNGTLTLDRGSVEFDPETYVHGENAVVYTEKYDDGEYLNVNGIREYETLVFRGDNESQLLAMFDEVSNEGYSLGEAYITGDMTMNSKHWYVEPSSWEEGDTFDVDVYVDGCTLTIPADKQSNINTSLYVQNGGQVNIDGYLGLHTDMLIMDGGTVTVEGAISTGTVYVYTGGKLIVNGLWYGYNPINMGGSIVGEIFQQMTQAQVEQLLKDTGYVVLRSPMTLTSDMVIEEGQTLHVTNEGYVLTVPAGKTLTVNGVLLLTQGAKLDIKGTLIVNGEVRVVGSDMVNTGAVENYGTVNILDGATLLNKGSWIGNQPVINGGTMAMSQEILEAQLKAAGTTKPVTLDTKVTLEKNMTITGQLYLADGGELIVPEGITLTNKGGITVDFGGKLDVDGKLLNYGSIIANDYFAEEACVSVAAYTHYTNASVAITCTDMGCAKVEGIDTKYQTILGDGSNAEIANNVFTMLVDRGYQDAMVFLYGQWDNETGEMLPGTVDGNIYVPVNGALIINNDQYVTLNGNITVDGLLGVSNAATLEVAAGSKISLSSTGAIEIQGTGRIIGEGMIDAQLNQINLPNQVECQIGYYATASNMTELLNAITAGLPEIHVIADFALTKGMTVPSDVTIVIEQGVTLTVNTTGAIVNNGEIIVDGKLVWVKGTLSGNRIALGENGEIENLPESDYYVPGTALQSFELVFDTDMDYEKYDIGYVPVQSIVNLYVKDIMPVSADFHYVAEITNGADAALVWNEETESYHLSSTSPYGAAAVVTATAVDKNGEPITDESGNFITDSITVQFAQTVTWVTPGGSLHSGGKLEKDVIGYVIFDSPDEYDLSDAEIVWYLNPGDEKYATLTGNGTTAILTAKDVTEMQVVTIHAKTADGVFVPWIEDAGEITIYPKITKLTLSIDGTDVTGKTIKHNLNNGGLELKRTISPAVSDWGEDLITWTSSDESIATVDEYGYVSFTGVEKNVIITAKANDSSGKTASVTITPVNMASYLYSYEKNLTDLTGGQSATYYVCSDLTDNPANNTTYMNPNVIEWYLSDAGGNAITSHPYASITAAGKLTTKAVENTSTVYLMARLKDDTNITLDHPVEVTIHPTITKIEIQDQSGAVLTTDIFDYETMGTVYNNFQLRTYPYDAVLKEIQWKSSNVNIAGFLDENGVLQASTTQTISNVEATSSDIVDLVAAGNNVAGTVTITATAVTHNNTKKTATFKITYGVFTKDIELTDVDGITIYEDATTIVRSGGTYTFNAKTVANDPDNWTPTNTTVTWAVDNTTAASISNGKLTAKTVYNPENVTVTVASKDGACTVTRNVVVLPSNKTGEALVLKLGDENVTKATKSFDAGMGFALTAFSVDETAVENGYLTEEIGITWKSGNTNVATVDENGNVSVVGNGTAVITATASDGRTAQMTVKGTKVSQFVEITSATGSNVVASGKTLALKATVTYTSGTPDSAVIWSVDNTSAAKVSTSGVVTATANLMETTYVTVTATPKDGMAQPATFEVIIVPLATGVQIFSAWDDCYPVDGVMLPAGEVLNNTTLTWDMNAAGNETMVLDAAVMPDGAMQGVTWTSSSAAIASFADKTVGELTFHKAGAVTITATANDGSGKKATFKIVVVKQMTDLYFDESLTGFQDYVLGGKSLVMSKFVTYGPADVTNKKLAWEIVGGCDYATINASTGALSTKAVTVPYEITVRVSSTDGSLNEYGETLYAEMTVTIYPATTKVNIYNEGLDITSKTVSAFVGDTLWLEAQSTPVESMMYHDKAVWQWTSSAADYVSIDETTGMATILKGGKTVTITAKALDGTNKTATFKITTLQPVENITFQNNLVIASGKQLQMAKLVTFEQEIQPTNTKLAWEIIEGSEYATINATTGVLTAGKVSLNKTVAVKATATDGSGVTGYCMVEIWPATTKLQIMDETNTDQTGKTIQVYLHAGEPEKTLAFTALATPGTALQESNVTWSVPAATAGYVDVDPETGVVTAKQGGKTVTVTAKAKDGSGKTATVRIQVIQLMTDMTVNNQPVGNELHFAKGKSTTLKVTAYPSTTANKNVTWSSVGGDGKEHITLSATGALKVLNTVTEKTSVTIRATAKDSGGYSEEFTLWLYPTLTTGVSVTAENAKVQVGGKLPLTAQSLPYAEADENSSAAQAWIWSTSSAAIATVDGDGVVTGVKAGTATITCKAVDGSGRSATFKVTVVNPE